MRSGMKIGASTRARLARIVDSGLPVLGVVIVLTAVLLGGGGWGPVWLAVTGLLMVEAGVWRLGSRMLHERRYLPLRREVQRFIGLARALNRASTALRTGDSPAARQALEETLSEMRASLDRMAVVAGKTEEDLETEQAPAPAPPLAS